MSDEEDAVNSQPFSNIVSHEPAISLTCHGAINHSVHVDPSVDRNDDRQRRSVMSIAALAGMIPSSSFNRSCENVQAVEKVDEDHLPERRNHDRSSIMICDHRCRMHCPPHNPAVSEGENEATHTAQPHVLSSGLPSLDSGEF